LGLWPNAWSGKIRHEALWRFASTAAMKILVSDPVFVDDLVRFLHGRQCSAEQIGARAIDARPPESSQDAAYLRKELKAYLRAWREMHPGVRVDLLESTAAASKA